MNQLLISHFALALALSFFATKAVMILAQRYNIVDAPRGERKVHTQSIPLLGGIAIYASLALAILFVLLRSNLLTGGEITTMHYAGFLLGGLILMIGGYLDDKYELPPKFSILAPVLAAAIVIGFGIEIEKLTNPLGGILYLESWQSDILVFVWLLAVMYTTKFLDGLDGLATSVSGIGTLMILLLSLTAAYYQPDVALLSAMVLGAMLGFLFWNWSPAKIFLGEGGSTFVGFTLGTLAVISGGKVATALLVLGIPLLDVFWVILRRYRKGGMKQVFKADKKHLHHRLLSLGLSHAFIVTLYILIASTFGLAALFLQSREKLLAFLLLATLTAIGAGMLVYREKRQESQHEPRA